MITHTLNDKAKYFIIADDIRKHESLVNFDDIEKDFFNINEYSDVFINKKDIFIYLGNRIQNNSDSVRYYTPNKLIFEKNKFYKIENNYPTNCISSDLYGDDFNLMNIWHECVLFVDDNGKKQLERIKKIKKLI